MNLQFAMDESSIRDIIASGNIALSPIRQIHKTSILLDHIAKEHNGEAIIICQSSLSVEHIERLWFDVYVKRMNLPNCLQVVYDSRTLDRLQRGADYINWPVYFDEYMNLDESERHKFYMMKHVNYRGGVATLR